VSSLQSRHSLLAVLVLWLAAAASSSGSRRWREERAIMVAAACTFEEGKSHAPSLRFRLEFSVCRLSSQDCYCWNLADRSSCVRSIRCGTFSVFQCTTCFFAAHFCSTFWTHPWRICNSTLGCCCRRRWQMETKRSSGALVWAHSRLEAALHLCSTLLSPVVAAGVATEHREAPCCRQKSNGSPPTRNAMSVSSTTSRL